MNSLYPSQWLIFFSWATLLLVVYTPTNQVEIKSVIPDAAREINQSEVVTEKLGGETDTGLRNSPSNPPPTPRQVKSSPPDIPDNATKSFDESRAQETLCDRWSNGIKKWKSKLQKFKLIYRKHMMNLKHFLNIVEERNNVPVFSEIDHLKSEFGEVYNYYSKLTPDQKDEFWLIYKERSARLKIMRLSMKSYEMLPIHRFKQTKSSKTAQSPQSPKPSQLHLIRSRMNLAQQVMKTLDKIEEGKDQYSQALTKSINIVNHFLRMHSEGGSISNVSRKIRKWKFDNPLKAPDMEHEYQMIFADLFGPGDLTKPEKDDDLIEKYKLTWKMNKEEIETFLDAASDARKMLERHYKIQEIQSQSKPKSILNYLIPSKGYLASANQFKKTQRKIHNKLLGLFNNEELLEKRMQEIARFRATEEDLVDKNLRSDQHDLLAFIEPLRACRTGTYYPDITPLLTAFGLHSNVQTMLRLMKLRVPLMPLLKTMYKQQMVARELRQSMLDSRCANMQHRILILLHETMDEHNERYLRMKDSPKSKSFAKEGGSKSGFNPLARLQALKRKSMAKLQSFIQAINSRFIQRDTD